MELGYRDEFDWRWGNKTVHLGMPAFDAYLQRQIDRYRAACSAAVGSRSCSSRCPTPTRPTAPTEPPRQPPRLPATSGSTPCSTPRPSAIPRLGPGAGHRRTVSPDNRYDARVKGQLCRFDGIHFSVFCAKLLEPTVLGEARKLLAPATNPAPTCTPVRSALSRGGGSRSAVAAPNQGAQVFSPSLQRFRRYLWAVAVLSAVVGAVVAVRLDGPGRATASVRHGPAAIHLPGRALGGHLGREPAGADRRQPVRTRLRRPDGARDRRCRAPAAPWCASASPTPSATAPLRIAGGLGRPSSAEGAELAAGTAAGAVLRAGARRSSSRRAAASPPIPSSCGVHPGTHLAVSLYLSAPSGPVTQHTQARQINWVAAGRPHAGPVRLARSSFRRSPGTCSAASTCSPHGAIAAPWSPSVTRSPTGWARRWTPTPATPTTWRDDSPPAPAPR